MLRFIYIILIFIFFISGCSGQKENLPKPQSNPKPLNGSMINRNIENDKAKNIANSILKTPGINKAVVVLNGTTALVGLNVNKSINTENNYKRISEQKVVEIDGNITNIEVTTDDTMYKRISKLNEDIKNGKPLGGIIEEFMGLIRRTKISSIFGG